MNPTIFPNFCLIFAIIIERHTMSGVYGTIRSSKAFGKLIEPPNINMRHSPYSGIFKRRYRGVELSGNDDSEVKTAHKVFKERGFTDNFDRTISVKEKEKIGDYGFFVDNRSYGADQSTMNTVNQQTFQQVSQNIQDSEDRELIVNVELNQVSQKSDRNQELQNPSQILSVQPEQLNEKFNKQISSNRQSTSDQIISPRGVSYDSDFTIGYGGYVGDVTKIATGGGDMVSPLYTIDNQGHNRVKNSYYSGNLISIPITTST